MVVTEGTSIVLSNSQATSGMISAAMQPSFMLSLTGIIGMLFAFGLILYIFSRFFGAFDLRKSQEYRQKMTDMYVVGVIKNFAKADSVFIEEELKLYNKDTLQTKKDKKRESQELDDTIESNLQEQVDAHTEQKIKEIKKEF